MLPYDWGRQTHGENMDWLEGANERELINLKQAKTEAWLFGIAFKHAYLSSRVEDFTYPESASEMFPTAEELQAGLSQEEIERREAHRWELEMNRMFSGLESVQNQQEEIREG